MGNCELPQAPLLGVAYVATATPLDVIFELLSEVISILARLRRPVKSYDSRLV